MVTRRFSRSTLRVGYYSHVQTPFSKQILSILENIKYWIESRIFIPKSNYTQFELINRPTGPRGVKAIIQTKDLLLLLVVTIMSVAANLLHDFSLLSGINRNFLLVGLMFVVAIALVRYTRFVLVATMFILAVGANLPHDIAQILNVDSRILMGSLIAILVMSLLNQFVKLPTGLDKPQGFPDEH